MGGAGVLQGPVETEVLGFIFDRYLREVAPTKARATRYQIKSCITTLRKVFGDVNIHTVTRSSLHNTATNAHALRRYSQTGNSVCFPACGLWRVNGATPIKKTK
ncbi:hypothetical protein LOK82_13910 [Xylella fastidiosa subsp. multiplex]|uniref:Uncharacterized protein n=1 Tax=Xylella fastidiosa subsp. multiplex TaxID=644357 RepID=A0AAW6HYR4_XYLFS|nr:hypothetical protein [Xylella fastidiosa subsp. multiplex]